MSRDREGRSEEVVVAVAQAANTPNSARTLVTPKLITARKSQLLDWKKGACSGLTRHVLHRHLSALVRVTGH